MKRLTLIIPFLVVSSVVVQTTLGAEDEPNPTEAFVAQNGEIENIAVVTHSELKAELKTFKDALLQEIKELVKKPAVVISQTGNDLEPNSGAAAGMGIPVGGGSQAVPVSPAISAPVAIPASSNPLHFSFTFQPVLEVPTVFPQTGEIVGTTVVGTNAIFTADIEPEPVPDGSGSAGGIAVRGVAEDIPIATPVPVPTPERIADDLGFGRESSANCRSIWTRTVRRRGLFFDVERSVTITRIR